MEINNVPSGQTYHVEFNSERERLKYWTYALRYSNSLNTVDVVPTGGLDHGSFAFFHAPFQGEWCNQRSCILDFNDPNMGPMDKYVNLLERIYVDKVFTSMDIPEPRVSTRCSKIYCSILFHIASQVFNER